MKRPVKIMAVNKGRPKMSTRKDKVSLIKHTEPAKVQNVRDVVIKQMKAKGMTAYGLAKLCGLTQQAIRSYMLGNTDMRAEKLSLILAVLDLEVRPRGRS